MQNSSVSSPARSSLLFKIMSLFLVSTFVLTSFSDNAEARRKRRKKARSKKAAIINEKKLFERIGGQKVLSDIVDDWIRVTLADGRISSYFGVVTAHPEKLAKFRKSLNEQMCDLADGPCEYKGPEFKKAHQGLKLGEEQYVAFAEDLFKSLQKFNIPEREKNELLGRLGSIKSEMVDEEPETP